MASPDSPPHRRRRRRRRPARRQIVQTAAAQTELFETRQLLAATPIAGLSDEFDNAASTEQWQRLNEVEGWNADQLDVYDINSTQSGQMVQQPHTVVWYQNWRGPMAFQNVTGDFVFTTEIHIADRDDVGGSDDNDVPGDSQYSLAGAMIRTPRDITDALTEWTPGSMADDGTNNGENYIFLSAGYGAGNPDEFALEVKTTRNSNSQLELTSIGSDSNIVRVQLARIGNSIIALYQLPGEEWTVHRRYSRPDMPETMQLPDTFAGLAEVLEGLLRHPQIQRLQLDSDLTDGWRVGAQLAQLLPIDEGLKYQLQGLTSVEQLLEEMDNILVELSGESDQTGR